MNTLMKFIGLVLMGIGQWLFRTKYIGKEKHHIGTINKGVQELLNHISPTEYSSWRIVSAPGSNWLGVRVMIWDGPVKGLEAKIDGVGFKHIQELLTSVRNRSDVFVEISEFEVYLWV